MIEAWETILFVHTNITQIQTNLDFNLIQLKTALKILTKVPTCQFKHQLFRETSHNLKSVGKNCIIMINQIKDKCHAVKKQVKQFISTLIDRLELQNVKYQRTMAQSASFSIQKVISIMIKIAEIVVLGETISSPMINKPIEDNHSISTHYVEEHHQLMELVNYFMFFQIHWDHLILLFSFIALRLNLIINERIDAMIKQISFKDTTNIIYTEQIFVIELIKPELTRIYEELCALCVIFHIYLDVSDKFILNKLDQFYLIHSHQNNHGNINNWETQTSFIEMQVKLFIQECQIKYNYILQQQQIQFNTILNQINNTL